MVRYMIDPDGPEPLYQQVAALLRDRIKSGELQPNRPIPSVAQLQGEYGIARGTALHAIEVLKQEGLVRVVPGRGTFVKPLAGE
jgi:GntR family transcriptional regulator